MLQGQEKYVIDVPLKTEAQNKWIEYLADVHIGPRLVILTLLALLGETLTTLLVWSSSYFWKWKKTRKLNDLGRGEQDNWRKESLKLCSAKETLYVLQETSFSSENQEENN